MCGGRSTKSLVDTQMSMPFSLAAVAVHGRLGVADIGEVDIGEVGRADPEVLRFMDLVTLEVDSVQSGSAHPIVTVRTTSGRSYVVRARDPLGSPSNPLSAEAIVARFWNLVAGVVPAEQANRIIDVVHRLDHLDDAGVLMSALGQTPA